MRILCFFIHLQTTCIRVQRPNIAALVRAAHVMFNASVAYVRGRRIHKNKIDGLVHPPPPNYDHIHVWLQSVPDSES